MPQEFSLTGAIPAPLTFKDEGNRYEVLRANHFGLEALARFERLEKEFHEIFEAVKSGQATQEQAGAQLDDLLADMIRTVCPTLPDERLRLFGFPDKLAFITWWRGEQPKPAQPLGEAQPGERVIRGRRSPGSSGATTSARPKAS